MKKWNKEKQHENMVVWGNIQEQNKLVFEILRNVSKYEYKMRSQIINANDLIGSNFVEGYYSGYLKEYIRFLKYSRRSCGELLDRVTTLYELEMINEDKFAEFVDLNKRTGYLIDRTRQSLEAK